MGARKRFSQRRKEEVLAKALRRGEEEDSLAGGMKSLKFSGMFFPDEEKQKETKDCTKYVIYKIHRIVGVPKNVRNSTVPCEFR